MSFENYADRYPNSFPNGNLVKHVDFLSVDYSRFDVIIILDGATWLKAIGPNFDQLLEKFPIEKLYLVDHHEKSGIYNQVTDRSIYSETKRWSTAEVLYLDFFKVNNIEIDDEIAKYLYYAIIFDTERFKFASRDTLLVASELLEYNIDHDKIVDFRVNEEEFMFTGWAIQHSLIYPFIQTMILPIYESDLGQMVSMFGENWMDKDLDNFYKAHFLRNVNGYNYGFTIIALADGATELRWRTNNSVINSLSIADVFKKIKAIKNFGGHRDSGGGIFDGTVFEAIRSITAEMEKQLKEMHVKSNKDKDWINYS